MWDDGLTSAFVPLVPVHNASGSATFLPLVPVKYRVGKQSRHSVVVAPVTPVRSLLRRSTSYSGSRPSGRQGPFSLDSSAPSSSSGDGDQSGESDSAGDVTDSGGNDVPNALPADLARIVDGRGKEGCEQCDGVGSIPCPVCNAKGFVSLTMMETVSATQCRMCHGRCVIPCPSCREFIFKSVIWWDQIPDEDEDPDENWRTGPDGMPRVPWGDPPA